ncbi:MAG: hypothetical protein AVDCRST_MAG78-2665 [uncultured Rubrobacteraceae bacterium]|uniref:Uncharacterized protein n=1 Tax=uncultured Rubrobacteraceae bacterium TaxID=349277 RepID=A0A6J4QLV2_9ACTN|nr:MAG: hypothetical protein AVDCRST_MAG78-2665 [uncultured Rubrobacteraceae bacterium]
MEQRQTAEATLRTPPFAFANGVLTSYAEGAKAYWRMWGPLGQPAIQTIDIWARSQRRYLEALETIVLPANGPQAPRSASRDLLRDLFTGGFGVGFDD